ncbi:MAG: hypothetical protein QM681_02575 [Novosphingobium sp.]
MLERWQVTAPGLVAGSAIKDAAAWANPAAALQITRDGAAEAMPTFKEIAKAGHLTL